MPSAEVLLTRLAGLRVLAGQHRVALSPDGRHVAYATRLAHGEPEPERGFYPTGAPVTARGCELWVTETQTGRTVVPLPAGRGRSWRPSWAADARSLAFYADAGGAVHLHVWRVGEPEPQVYPEAVIRCRAMAGDRPRWSPDGRWVYVPLCPEGLERAFTGAEVRDGPALVLRSGDTSADTRLRWRADLGRIDVRTGAVQRLVTGVAAAEPHLSPDGRHVAFYTLARDEPQSCELYLLAADGGEPAPVAVGLAGQSQWRHQPAWHPAGDALAWLRDGRPFVRRVGQEVSRPFGESPPEPADERYLAWTPDGQGLVLRGRSGALWVCRADGRPAVRLQVQASGRPLQPSDRDAVAVAGGAILVPSGTGLLRVPLDGGPSEAVWHDEAACDFQAWSNTWHWLGDATADAGTAVFARETSRRPADLWVMAGGGGPRQLTHLNPDVESCVAARTVAFSLPEARPSQGLLWVPEGASGPLPTVVVLHPDLQPSAARHRFEPEAAAGFGPQYLVALGLAVWMPDFGWPGGDQDRGERIAADVTAAVDAAVAAGWADPGRLALVGYGLGAYAVHALLVRSARFSAAVSTAGVVNFSAYHGRLQVWQGAPDTHVASQCEGLLGREGGPWTDPAWYVQNSPLFRLDRVRTPVLFIAGREPAPESEAMFAGLCRLGVTAEFARYPEEEGEAPFHWRAEAYADAARRIAGWLLRWMGS